MCELIVSWMSVSIASAILAIALSVLIEYVPKWEMVEPRWKRIVILVVSFAIPFAVQGLLFLFRCVALYTDAMLRETLTIGFGVFTTTQIAQLPTLGKPRTIEAKLIAENKLPSRAEEKNLIEKTV
jgi:hypothetical protein